jgi:hypothetical protein
MEPGFVFFLLAAAAVLASLGVAAIFLAPIAMRHLLGARGGGWGDLARVYATTKPPPPALPGQTLMVGFTQYRRCVAVAADETGLYLKLGFPLSFLRRPALLIPWTAFARVEKGRLYWREAAVLSVGDPLVATITAPMELFEKIRPRLASSLIGAGET